MFTVRHAFFTATFTVRCFTVRCAYVWAKNGLQKYALGKQNSCLYSPFTVRLNCNWDSKELQEPSLVQGWLIQLRATTYLGCGKGSFTFMRWFYFITVKISSRGSQSSIIKPQSVINIGCAMASPGPPWRVSPVVLHKGLNKITVSGNNNYY